MFIDASALTALLTDEDEARELLARLQQSRTRLTSPLAVWEAAVAVARVLGLSVSVAAEAVEDYVALMEIVVVAVSPETARIALDAAVGERSARVSARRGAFNGGTVRGRHAEHSTVARLEPARASQRSSA